MANTINFELEIPNTEIEVYTLTDFDLSVGVSPTVEFDLYISGNTPVTLPSISYVWILSSSITQPFGTRGIWIDSSTWDDSAIWYN